MRVSTKVAGLFANDVADLIRSAEFAKMDWRRDVTGAAKMFARAGKANASALATAIYNAHGVDVTGPAAQKALRANGGKRSKLSAKVLKDLQEYQAVSQNISSAKAKAFGTSKPRTAKVTRVRVSRKAKALVRKLEALGYTVKLSVK